MPKKTPTVLGIETTCDDTGIGIVRGRKVLANAILSSNHEKFGGVVPEIASRAHEANVLKAFFAALGGCGLQPRDITHVAYAQTPGLPGPLHVGCVFAKTVAYALGVPLIALNHLHSHVFSAMINKPDPLSFPCLGLVVSGGHTAIYLVRSLTDVELLEQTADDAIGEVYDKVGRSLGLAYPAGAAIDAAYDPAKAFSVRFLAPATKHEAFSYSGFKTAVINHVNALKKSGQPVDAAAILSSFQRWIVSDFAKRVERHAKSFPGIPILLGGGVSANRLLREELGGLGGAFFAPDAQFTGDNGAMHAYYADLLIAAGRA